MKFLKLMNDWYLAINRWMGTYIWLTILFGALFVVCLIGTWHFISPTLAMVIYATYVISILVIMMSSTAYLVASGYEPPRCDKCGQVLPDERH